MQHRDISGEANSIIQIHTVDELHQRELGQNNEPREA